MNPFQEFGNCIRGVGSALGNLLVSKANSDGVRSLADKNVKVGLDTLNHPAVKNVFITIVNNNGSGTIHLHTAPQDSLAGKGGQPFASITEAWSLLDNNHLIAGFLGWTYSYGFYLYLQSLDFHSYTENSEYSLESELKIWEHLNAQKEKRVNRYP